MKKIFGLAAVLAVVGTTVYAHPTTAHRHESTVHQHTDAVDRHSPTSAYLYAGTAHLPEPDPTNQAVRKSFNKSFAEATHINWEKIGQYYRANFKLEEGWVYAYFSADGRELAVSRKLDQDQLPLQLARLLHEKLKNGSLVELFEVVIDGQTTYYTRVNNPTHSILYNGTASGNWQVFKKTRHRR